MVTAPGCVIRILRDLADAFDDPDCPYVHRLDDEMAYGKTMHWFAITVRPREWTNVVPGFVPRLLLQQSL